MNRTATPARTRRLRILVGAGALALTGGALAVILCSAPAASPTTPVDTAYSHTLRTHHHPTTPASTPTTTSTPTANCYTMLEDGVPYRVCSGSHW